MSRFCRRLLSDITSSAILQSMRSAISFWVFIVYYFRNAVATDIALLIVPTQSSFPPFPVLSSLFALAKELSYPMTISVEFGVIEESKNSAGAVFRSFKGFNPKAVAARAKKFSDQANLERLVYARILAGLKFAVFALENDSRMRILLHFDEGTMMSSERDPGLLEPLYKALETHNAIMILIIRDKGLFEFWEETIHRFALSRIYLHAWDIALATPETHYSFPLVPVIRSLSPEKWEVPFVTALHSAILDFVVGRFLTTTPRTVLTLRIMSFFKEKPPPWVASNIRNIQALQCRNSKRNFVLESWVDIIENSAGGHTCLASYPFVWNSALRHCYSPFNRRQYIDSSRDDVSKMSLTKLIAALDGLENSKNPKIVLYFSQRALFTNEAGGLCQTLVTLLNRKNIMLVFAAPSLGAKFRHELRGQPDCHRVHFLKSTAGSDLQKWNALLMKIQRLLSWLIAQPAW